MKHITYVLQDVMKECRISQEQAETYLDRILEMYAGGMSRSEIVVIICTEIKTTEKNI
jgi:uncharacterized protein YoaH (UPF0181 family)